MDNAVPGSPKVVKSDGTLEPFQFAKVRRGLAAAMRSCRYDDRYADALARAVEIHVQEWTGVRPPTTDYLHRCVREVLVETGLTDVAAEVERHRTVRRELRKRVSVVDARRRGRRNRPWSKARVVQTLVRRHALRPEVARIVGAEIEQRVLGLRYQVVSSSLIAELIRNELMAWGLCEVVSCVSAPGGAVAQPEAAKET